ncbi:MAG: B12-binding domain-containing radical SAM protein, partial [Planctomycetota bacterium]
MDELPLPRRDLTERYRDAYYFLFDRPDTSVATGRGCPFRCNFCSVWVFSQGKTRQMSAQRVVEEIASVDTDHITFVDDNFLMNQKREHAIADLIKSAAVNKRYSMECRTDSIVRHPELVSKWVDVGLYAVLLGLEGASDKMLKTVNKRNTSRTNDEAIRILQDHGVIIWGAFIADPDWEEDDFVKLRDYVSRNRITHTQFTVLTPLPGTVLYRQKLDELL